VEGINQAPSGANEIEEKRNNLQLTSYVAGRIWSIGAQYSHREVVECVSPKGTLRAQSRNDNIWH